MKAAEPSDHKNHFTMLTALTSPPSRTDIHLAARSRTVYPRTSFTRLIGKPSVTKSNSVISKRSVLNMKKSSSIVFWKSSKAPTG